MKLKWSYVGFLGLVMGIYAFTEATFEKETKSVPQAVQEQCDLDGRVPKNLEELSLKTGLILDLRDNCNFQPIHIQARSGYPATEIIARVFGEEKSESTFLLSRMELKHFEIADSPNPVVIDSAYITQQVIGKPIINVILLDLNSDCDNCQKKNENYNQGGIDFSIDFSESLPIQANTVFDTHIVNELDLYPVFGLKKYDDVAIPVGRHCDTRVIF